MVGSAPTSRRRLAPGRPRPPRHQRRGGAAGAVGAMVASIMMAGVTAGKRFDEGRDRIEIFGGDSIFRATETRLHRVSGGKTAES
jgi:hypothetical protein